MARKERGKHGRERDGELSEVNCVTGKRETGERGRKRHIFVT
jgi:hypothetical protein